MDISPPHLADLATERTVVNAIQGTARTIDQEERDFTGKSDSVTNKCVIAMIEAACQSFSQYTGTAAPKPLSIYRLEKADTRRGIESLQQVARESVHYSVLLYERLLGRPFASHRDSVSELVDGIVEAAISKAGWHREDSSWMACRRP